ncbi:MAG: type II toxin-antitoxin system PemK/MazF family toxin [Ignavibacteriales bacterium]
MTFRTTSTTVEDGFRRDARQGDFFWARFQAVTGDVRTSPVFVAGSDNDCQDVIVCLCTTKSPRTKYDVRLHLAGRDACIRTNKIYTILRTQLLQEIDHQSSPNEMTRILGSVKSVFGF